MSRQPKVTRERGILAANMRRLRAQRSLSQEDLADLAGLHRTYVGSIERCERNVSIDNIVKLASALEVKASELLDDGDEQAPEPPSPKGRKSHGL